MSSELDEPVLGGLRNLGGHMSQEQRFGILSALGLVDEYVTVSTAIGDAMVAFNQHGISYLRVATTPALFAAGYARQIGPRPLTPARRPPPGLVTALRTGRTRRIRVDLRSLAPFQRDVLAAAREIPVGEVRPYRWIAAAISRPNATRAVGTALGHNPVPLVIPCHRVVRSDGKPGGYVFGAVSKEGILRREGVDIDYLVALHRRGVGYIGSDTTGVFCHPTCHNARRITDEHRVLLRDAMHAENRHFRPCRACRPVPSAA